MQAGCTASRFVSKDGDVRQNGHPEPEHRDFPEAHNPDVERLNGLMRDLTHVVHGLGHDLREPIRIVNCYAELLKTRTSIESEPAAKAFLHEISAAAHRMDALLTGILDYGRLLGSDGPVREKVDMNSVMQTALANLQMQIDEAAATIAYDDLPEVTGDFAQLTQLMQNLVANAIKYRSTDPPQIVIKAVVQDGQVQFSVQDNGVGIDEQYHERLFVPFKRMHGRDIPGAGLGLAICRSIVERHGGRIRAESKPGEGSTFIFTLSSKVPL
jgi:light-regulated signal transduction histidine kinase (bacteriophytochrome)